MKMIILLVMVCAHLDNAAPQESLPPLAPFPQEPAAPQDASPQEPSTPLVPFPQVPSAFPDDTANRLLPSPQRPITPLAPYPQRRLSPYPPALVRPVTQYGTPALTLRYRPATVPYVHRTVVTSGQNYGAVHQQAYATGYSQPLLHLQQTSAVRSPLHPPLFGATVQFAKYAEREVTPALLQRTVDLARPALQTRKYEVRRPAIQKQFYDIEQHIVVRPAGSALVELEAPLSTLQRGPSMVTQAVHDRAPAARLVGPKRVQHELEEAFEGRPNQVGDHQRFESVTGVPPASAHFATSTSPSAFAGQTGLASSVETRSQGVQTLQQQTYHGSHQSGTRENQRRLLELLTARGGVVDVGFERAGTAEHIGDAGFHRARVLAAHTAPLSSQNRQGAVNTRRIVISRPIETVQEVEVSEPVTKVDRVTVERPAAVVSERQRLLQQRLIQHPLRVYGEKFPVHVQQYY